MPPVSMWRIWPTTASRKSRSCEIISSVPGKALSQPSSQSTASRSRWLVGSSSSSRSERDTSARARLRRTRQPPEKSATGAAVIALREAEAGEDLGGARLGRIALDVLQPRVQLGDAVAVVGILRRRAGPPRPTRSSVSPSSTNSSAGAGSAGVSCATWPMRQPGGQFEVAGVLAAVRRAAAR